MSSRKRRRTQHAAMEDVAPPKHDYISTLPWELVAEILSITSPKEVLAMARCSRHFFDSLVANPRSKFIWEAARNSCVPPLPKPTPNFTEPAYAAYIFDGGPCEECGAFTNTFFRSFSLRLRLCSGKCCEIWLKDKAIQPKMEKATAIPMTTLLHMEDLNELGGYKLESGRCFRKYDFNQVLRYGFPKQSSRRYAYYFNLAKGGSKHIDAVMTLSEELSAWKYLRERYTGIVKTDNIKFLSEIAQREGWKFGHLRRAPTCLCTIEHCNRAPMKLTEAGFNVIKSTVETEIAKMVEHEARSKEEQAYAERRELVALDYHRKRSAKSTETDQAILPTLDVFREQEVIKALQNKQGCKPEDVAAKLKDETVQEMINNSLASWKDRVRKDFMKILGFKKYFGISAKKLHPVDRLTARFLCSLCLAHAPNKDSVPPLDFRQACRHQCRHLTEKQKKRAKWSSDNFELDPKAIKATKKVLDLLTISEEEEKSLQVPSTVASRLRCKSCDGKIIMTFEVMQCHSHRHEDMDIEILSPAEVMQLKQPPIRWGLCNELTSMSRSAPKKAELKIYGCRHCLQQQELAGTQMETDDQVNRRKAPQQKSKLMSLHGLRSHILQVHRIKQIADEDVFRMADNDASE